MSLTADYFKNEIMEVNPKSVQKSSEINYSSASTISAGNEFQSLTTLCEKL